MNARMTEKGRTLFKGVRPLWCAALVVVSVTGCVSRPPTIAHVHVGHAVTGVHVTPGQKGYFQQAEERAREAAEQARARGAGQDLAEIKGVAATIITATNSKEQFGLKYALLMAAIHINFAATSPDASVNLQQAAPVFAQNIMRVIERCELIALLGKDVEASTSLPEVTVLAAEISRLAAANLDGEDTDGDGKLGSTPAEYGVSQLKVELDGLVARENPPYRSVDQRFLFNLVKLPNGRWMFDQLGHGGNIEGYQ